MCGIAGIMFKDASLEGAATGDALISMLDGCQHRGPDSTGFALYGDLQEDQYQLRFFVDEGEEGKEAIARIREILAEYEVEIVEDETVENNYRVTVTYRGDIQSFAYALEHAAKVISIGTSLEIIKDVGSAHEVNDRFHVSDYKGTHGLGHVRLATESEVKPEAAHPFWATGFADVAIVHNGQITNYFLSRNRLERKGYRFMTENDSELLAVWISDRMSQGLTQAMALRQTITEIDGVFTFLISDTESMGFVKDRWAMKPNTIGW